jgi:hypothetical protein
MQLYSSADRLLNRYVELNLSLGSPKTTTWPDANDPPFDTASRLPPHMSRYARLVCELADIAVCIRNAKLSQDEQRVFYQLYRARKRYCLRCHLTSEHDAPRCPRCGTPAREGWSFEPFPTLPVLRERLERSDQTRRWTIYRLRQTRDRAYARLEIAMKAKGLLGDVPEA